MQKHWEKKRETPIRALLGEWVNILLHDGAQKCALQGLEDRHARKHCKPVTPNQGNDNFFSFVVTAVFVTPDQPHSSVYSNRQLQASFSNFPLLISLACSPRTSSFAWALHSTCLALGPCQEHPARGPTAKGNAPQKCLARFSAFLILWCPFSYCRREHFPVCIFSVSYAHRFAYFRRLQTWRHRLSYSHIRQTQPGQ